MSAGLRQLDQPVFQVGVGFLERDGIVDASSFQRCEFPPCFFCSSGDAMFTLSAASSTDLFSSPSRAKYGIQRNKVIVNASKRLTLAQVFDAGVYLTAITSERSAIRAPCLRPRRCHRMVASGLVLCPLDASPSRDSRLGGAPCTQERLDSFVATAQQVKQLGRLRWWWVGGPDATRMSKVDELLDGNGNDDEAPLQQKRRISKRCAVFRRRRR
ncbi:hypothetical protein BDZ89DRAFT_1059698 [Hymenopellis radicata]|nr:hypothetical protein BDZ89DRAFT_1059698 [Hymenopellis radicata]